MEYQQLLWITFDFENNYIRTHHSQTEDNTMFCKNIMQEEKGNSKQFATATGSPILYTRFKNHKGIYYPIPKHHTGMKAWIRRSHSHFCVVYSKMYGRETYGNIGIWPDDKLKEFKSQTFHTLPEYDDMCTDLQNVVSKAPLEQQIQRSTEGSCHTKTPNDMRHVTITVTDTTGEIIPSSSYKLIHPLPDTSHERLMDTDGTWPLKRLESIGSRDNPFLPEGDLRKEADEILAKATIIRDTFVLKESCKNSKAAKQTLQENKSSNSPVEEQIVQYDVAVSECSEHQMVPCLVLQTPPPQTTDLKENGLADTENSLTPEHLNLDIADDNKDRKKQKKCCTIM